MSEVLSLFRGVINVRKRNGATSPCLPTVQRDEAVQDAAQAFGCTAAEILGRRRRSRIVRARQYAMWLLREQGYSYPEIGRQLGRDHTSVVHGVRAHERRLAEGA